MSWEKEQETQCCTFSFVMIGKARIENLLGAGGCFLLRMLSALAPCSKGSFSCVKHASDWACKHPWQTHSNALIIGSNQMNYRWPALNYSTLYTFIWHKYYYFLSALHHEYLCFNVSIRGIYPPLIRSYVIFRIKLHKLWTAFFFFFTRTGSKASVQD